MDIVKLPVAPRPIVGSAESRRLRRAGRVPATLYGLGREPVSLSVDAHDLALRVQKGARVFDLSMDERKRIALLRDLQVDAVTDQILHVDFSRVDETSKVRVRIPLHFFGIPLMATGATVEHILQDLEVECLPRNIPGPVEVVLTDMAPGTTVRAQDVKLPEGVTLATAPDQVVVTYAVHRPEAEAPAEAAPLEVIRERKPTPEA